MTEQMLKRQIKRYSNDAIRFKLKADRHYAAWKTYGDQKDFIYSQNFYRAAERADKIRQNYEEQLLQLPLL